MRGVKEGEEPVVLGAELAAARAIEELRKQRATEASPLEDLVYTEPGGGVTTPGFEATDIDVALRERLLQWEDLDAAGYAELRARVSMNDAYTIMRFAHRATSLGLSTGDQSWPEAALAGLPAIGSDRVDERDLAWATALTAFTLHRVGGEVVLALAKAKARADLGATAIIARFEEAPPLSLREWGYQEVESAGRIFLVRTEYKPFKPTFDIVASARAVAAAIEDDEHYMTRSITIGTELPKNWVRGSRQETAAVEALERVTAAANVWAVRLGVEQPMRLMFTVWLVEFPSDTDATVVAAAATEATGDHARLAVPHGRALALMIARAVDPAIENPETGESLQRFADAVLQALTDEV